MTPDIDGLIERLREEGLTLQQVAWSRLDGGQECSISAALADEAASQLEALKPMIAERERLLAALDWAADSDPGLVDAIKYRAILTA
jgi:hypothetical protein